jgi:hypothetical protein
VNLLVPSADTQELENKLEALTAEAVSKNCQLKHVIDSLQSILATLHAWDVILT